jgi:transcriptional regulator with XRE-family HTH domain
MTNEKLIAARKRKFLTQEDLAEIVGVVPVTISRWENGEQRPRSYALRKLCQVLQASREELGFSSEPTGEADREPAPATFSLAISATDMLDVAIMGLILAQQQHHWTLDELRLQVERKIEALSTMNQQHQKGVSRRDTLEFLARLPLAMWGLTKIDTTSPLLAPEEILPLHAASIPACWNLFFSGQLAEVETVLPTYLSYLTPLAEHPSALQKDAASLASQTHQLAALFSKEVHEDFGASLEHCKQALHYGQIAQDQNLIAASFIREVDTLYCRKRYPQIFQLLQQAEGCTPEASPLLRGRIYCHLAASFARYGQEQDALRYIGLAHDTFPDQPRNDPGFSYTHTDHYILHLNEMVLYLRLNQPQEAWKAIMEASAFVPSSITPRRAELLSQIVTASIALNDLDQGCFYFAELATLGTKLKANLFISEAQTSYQEMQLKWPHEKRVKALAELLHL